MTQAITFRPLSEGDLPQIAVTGVRSAGMPISAFASALRSHGIARSLSRAPCRRRRL